MKVIMTTTDSQSLAQDKVINYTATKNPGEYSALVGFKPSEDIENCPRTMVLRTLGVEATKSNKGKLRLMYKATAPYVRYAKDNNCCCEGDPQLKGIVSTERIQFHAVLSLPAACAKDLQNLGSVESRAAAEQIACVRDQLNVILGVLRGRLVPAAYFDDRGKFTPLPETSMVCSAGAVDPSSLAGASFVTGSEEGANAFNRLQDLATGVSTVDVAEGMSGYQYLGTDFSPAPTESDTSRIGLTPEDPLSRALLGVAPISDASIFVRPLLAVKTSNG